MRPWFPSHLHYWTAYNWLYRVVSEHVFVVCQIYVDVVHEGDVYLQEGEYFRAYYMKKGCKGNNI